MLSAFGVLGIKIWPLSLLFYTRTSTCTLRSALQILKNNLNVLILDFAVPIHKSHTNRTYKRCKWLKLVSNPFLIFSCLEENCSAGIRTRLCKLGRLPISTVRLQRSSIRKKIAECIGNLSLVVDLAGFSLRYAKFVGA